MDWCVCVCGEITHRLALIEVDIIGVWDEEESIPPLLVVLQILEQRAREDGLILQRNLWREADP